MLSICAKEAFFISSKEYVIFSLKVLIKEISTFREKITYSFDEMKKASLAHIDSITFVLDSYSNLSKTQRNLLEKTIKQLTQVSKMTYKNFITELKKGELTTLG